jgi:hypothetical protein
VTRVSVGFGNKRRSRRTAAALMATAVAGYSRARARSEPGEVFIGQELHKQCRLSVVLTGTAAWAPRRWTTCGGAPPVADGGAPARMCTAAACHRPRGRRRVTPIGA